MHKGDTVGYNVNQSVAGRRRHEKKAEEGNRTAGHIVAEGCKKLLQITGSCRLHTNGLIYSYS